MQDALGVVEPVHAEQHDARLADGLPDFPRALPDLLTLGDLGEAGRVDRDRERGRLDLARPARFVDPHGRALGGQADGPAAGPQEVDGVGPALESQQVGAEQAQDHLAAPRQLGEDLVAGERYVVEKADPDVVAQLAQQPGNQLELVVVHPDGGPGRRLLRRRLREPPVDGHVRVPPVAMELRRGDHVVVERPQRRVAEALVVVADLVLGKSQPDQVQAVGLERARGRARIARPADPYAPGLAHDGFQGGDQAAGALLPLFRAVQALDPVDRQPARDHHEAVLGGFGLLAHLRHIHFTLAAGFVAAVKQQCRAS